MKNVQITFVLSLVLVALAWPGKKAHVSHLSEGILMSVEAHQTSAQNTEDGKVVNAATAVSSSTIAEVKAETHKSQAKGPLRAKDMRRKNIVQTTPLNLTPSTVTVTDPVQKEKPDYFTLKEAVKGSVSSFNFTDSESSNKNVDVKAVSTTPWNEKQIISIDIDNEQEEYFFIESLSFYKGKDILDVQSYYQTMVGPHKTVRVYSLLESNVREKIRLVLAESKGKQRTYSLMLNIP